MKIYLQSSAASVLLCAVMALFAFASDSVEIMEEPATPASVPVYEETHRGEVPILFPEDGWESSVSELPPDTDESSISSESEPESSESEPESSSESSEPSENAVPPESSESSASEQESEPVSSSQPQSSSEPAPSEPSSESSAPPSSEPSQPPVPSSEPSSESSAVQPPIPSETPSESTQGPPGYSEITSSETSSEQTPSGETVRAIINGTVQTVDMYDFLCRTVEAEMGSSFSMEALKAQAVAAYTYIKHENGRGVAVSLPLKTASQKAKDAVSAVLGQAVYYNGKVAFTPYFASSAGWTNPSAEVWGGSYSYLTRVESIYDPSSNNKNVKAVFSADKVQSGLEKYLGIDLEGSDPANWLNIVSVSDSNYVLKVEVTDASGAVHTVTGRQVRENVLSYGLRSHSFTVTYENGSFTFITNGYGHGCGMSQTGANGYAQNGWSYVQILNHYYPGTSVR